MIYRNPRPNRPRPEHAARGEHRELLHLLLAVGLILTLGILAVDRLTVWLAPKLPFSVERRLAQTLHLDSLAGAFLGGPARRSEPQRAIEQALQQRADRILRVLQTPADIAVTLHYLDVDAVNAIATLGGHIVVFRGLLEKLEHEQELDAVIAHEIGHVVHRHMIQHLGRGVMTAVALGSIGVHSASLNRWLLGDLQHWQQLAYGRDAEREADDTALLASRRLYGTAEGVVAVFRLFERLQQRSAPAWTQSHPLPAERARRAQELPGAERAPYRPTPLGAPLALNPDP